jgi:hypothetical protein
MRTQFFSGIISKITVLFCVFGFIGITGFHYLNTHNQGSVLLASDEVKVQKKH